METHLPTERDKDAWQVAIWNLADDQVSRPQKLQFMLMLEGQFNNFDPFRVVGDLLRRRELWRGVVMDRGYVLPDDARMGRSALHSDLIKLRDVESACWNVDTLFILTDSSRDAEWDQLMESWKADELSSIEHETAEALLGCYGLPASLTLRTAWWD
jgi:hypothetical protein